MVARCWAVYVRIVEYLAMAGIVLVLVVGGAQVFFRYVVGESLFWSEELMRYAMIWLVMATAGLAFSHRQFLGMRTVVDHLPPRARRAVEIASALLMAGFLAVIAYYGAVFAWRTRAHLATALEISMFWIHVSVVVGAVLMGVHIVANQIFGRFTVTPDDAGAGDA